MASAVVISDTHFGVESVTLANPKKVDRLISEIWRYGEGCDRVVLLGDIFDFWRSRPETAIRDSIHLFKRLSELDVEIDYVVGNHDHHMAVMSQESEFLERIARGDIYPVYIPSMRWRQTINELRINTFYPIFDAKLAGKRVLFTHGHHLNGIGSVYTQWERLRRLRGSEISPADMEMMMTCAYEGIYRSSYIGEMAGLEERIWSASSALDKVKAGILRRSMPPVDSQYDAIMKFIKERHLGRVDCFVYGDTHRPGICRMDGLVAVNAGSFTPDSSRSSEGSITDTFLVIGDGGLTLRKLGMGQPLWSMGL
jgi:UDP-2,3-diacylglucosamine pyrophosphatase LpxH